MHITGFSFRLVALLAVFSLCACLSSGEKPKLESESSSVEILYERANKAMEKEDYANATKFFEEVERQHPYSRWSARAQLMAAYSSYLGQSYEEALIALDRYIQLHPGASDVDYAYYLKALCYYEQISNIRRDQEMTMKALHALSALIKRFPQSEYARDATLKRDLTLDHLAGKEMEIGRYYLTRSHINAAINRFRSVIANFQTTGHVPEALHRLVESYMTLGLKNEAYQVAAVLGHNYPGNIWYERSYKLLDDNQRKNINDERGFIERTLDTLLR